VGDARAENPAIAVAASSNTRTGVDGRTMVGFLFSTGRKKAMVVALSVSLLVGVGWGVAGRGLWVVGCNLTNKSCQSENCA
jgi:hypothetical protein